LTRGQHSDTRSDAQRDDYEVLHSSFRWQVDEHFNIAEVCCARWARAEAHPENAIKKVAVRAYNPPATTVFHTYSELKTAADVLSHLLESLGVRRGDRVAIVMPQRFETAVAYMAVLQMGAVAMPLSMLFGPDALEYRLKDSGAVVAICDDSSIANVQSCRASCNALCTVIAVGAAVGRGDVDYAATDSGSGREFAMMKTRAADAAILIYTSGTTGPPKGALLPHRALIGNLPGFVCSQNWFGFSPVHPELVDGLHDKASTVRQAQNGPGSARTDSEAVFWSPADWAWTGGLMDALLPTLYFGRPIVAFNGRFSPEHAFNLMEQEGVTHTFLFPTALKAMMKAFPRPRLQFRLQLAGLMSAGEAVGDAVFDYCERELGVVVNEMFGQTEINYIVGNCAPTLPTACGSLPPEGAACRGFEPASAGLDGTQKGGVSHPGSPQGLRLQPGEASSMAPAGEDKTATVPASHPSQGRGTGFARPQAQRPPRGAESYAEQTKVGAIFGWPARPGSMGKGYPGHRVAVIDDDGNECAVGVPGDVALNRYDVHGEPDPIFFLGYWNNDAATRAKFTGDWCRTGDLARRDADGYLWYEGRADDVFKSAGYRIGPGEIENCLVRHPAVANAAVVPKPDRERGAVVKAYVVLAPDLVAARALDTPATARLDEEIRQKLQNHVKTRLAPYEYPKEIEFIAALPMTTTGKVQRRVLRLQEAARFAEALRLESGTAGSRTETTSKTEDQPT
jgi:acyl-coenzyme A synthetase/AMP-(fatty) acid ligase